MSAPWLVAQADAMRLPLADESVDLCVTSPPYFSLRSYRDGDEHYDGQVGSEATPQAFLEALWAATAEMVRVLKPTGSIFLNLGDKYAGSGGHNNNGLGSSTLKNDGRKNPRPDTERQVKLQADNRATRRNAPDRYNQDTGGIRPKSLMGLPWRYAIGCIDRLGLILRAEVVWSKPNGLPESVTDRVRRSHENWFHFTKEGRYFAAVDEVRTEHVPGSWSAKALEGRWHRRNDVNRAPDRGQGDTNLKAGANYAGNPLGALPGSVWTIPSEPLIIPEAVQRHYDLPDHFAAFPSEFPRRIILGWSPSGVCVACGEGRRPVVVKTQDAQGRTTNGPRSILRRSEMGGTNGAGREVRTVESATITGYACSCPDTSAATRPSVICDPFSGTGTVVGVARALGRVGVGFDLSADYCRLALWRVTSGSFAKARARTDAEAQGTLIA